MRAQMDTSSAKLLRRAGCRDVFVGVESFDDATLAAMNKRRTEADNVQALRAFLEAGINVVAGFIPGFPGDSRAGYLYSADRMRDLQAQFPGQLSVNTEPFRLSPGQPLYKNLEQTGLVPRHWAADYLEIAPRYRETTENILCSVEGANQGLERIGRERIAFMITTDEPVRTDKFDYDEDEAVCSHQFTTRHVFGGWHLASIKSGARIHALIVTSSELDGLEDLAAAAKLMGVKHPELATRLQQLASRHLHCVPLDRPPLPHPTFSPALRNQDVVRLSPFVVVRQMDWRHKKQILIVNYLNGRVLRRVSRDGRVLSGLASAGPIAVHALLSQLGNRDPSHEIRSLRVLCRHGVVTVQHAVEERHESSNSGRVAALSA